MAFSSPIFLSPNLPLHKIPPISPQTHKPQSSSSSSFPIRCSSTHKSPPPPFDLRSYWTSYISLIQSDLDAAIPIRHPARIYESMRYSVLSAGAKRASPVLCIAACELLGGDRSLALPTASALEMVHTASLIHDDLPCMDAAPLRRGSPSNHAAFGVDLAVLTGDALFPLAFTHVVARTPAALVPPETILRVIEEIARAVGPTGMAAGQMLDLSPPGGNEDAMAVLEKKFGEMAECSAVCGGLLGGAGEEELEGLRRYGRAVGVLYEVVDDVLMEGEGGNGRSGKMRSNASVVRAMGMERSLEIAEELRARAKEELKVFGEKYGEGVLPLYSFVDYAVERDFKIVEESADSG